MLTLAWGIVSFGAVYPWAYWPLLIACGATGCFALAVGSRPVNRPLALGLSAVLVAIAIQITPAPSVLLTRVSPGTHAFQAQHDVLDLAAALPPIASALKIDVSEVAKDKRRHFLSVDPAATRRGMAFVAGLGLFMLGIARALDRRDIRFLIVGSTMLAVGLSILAVAERSLPSRSIYGFWEPLDGGNPFGPFVNPNHFAGFILMVLPLTAGLLLAKLHREGSESSASLRERILWFSSREGSQVFLLMLALGVMALAVTFTLSRSGIACLAAIAVFFAWAIVRRDRIRSRRALVLTCVAVIAFISVTWVGLDRIVTEFVGNDGRSLTLEGRQTIWRDTTEIIRDFPIVGSGLSTYNTAMRMYEDGELYSAVHAHNDYLQLAAEGGILVGLPAIILVGILINGVKRRFREESEDPAAYWIRIGAVGSLLGIALQETVEFSLQLPGNAAIFCFLCGVALSHLRRDSGVAYRRPSAISSRLAALAMAGTLVAGVASGLVAYRTGGPYGDRLDDRHIHRIYNVPQKRLVNLLYDGDRNGLFDISIDLEDRSAIVIETDTNEDGVAELWEQYGPDFRIEKRRDR